MSFVHGKSGKVYVGGYDLTSYFKTFTLSASGEPADVTCLGATNHAYIAGLKDATLSVEGLYEGTASSIDERLNAALGSSTQVVVSVLPEGDTAAKHSYVVLSDETNYEMEAPVDDVISCSAEFQSSCSAERGYIAVALAAKTTDSNTSNIDDNGAGSTAGGYYTVHCTAISGGTCTVTFKHDDDVGFATPTSETGLAITAIGAWRSTVNTTFNRYVRVYWALTGGCTSCTIHVSFHRT